jgi:hypothetical protein
MRAAQTTALLFLLAVIGCVRKVADYPAPPNAKVTPSGVRSLTVTPGKGEPATAGELYGVNWTLLSHTKRGCDHPCVEREFFPRSELKDPRWREVILSMREGETRRVWIVEKPKQEPRVYDVTLGSVDRLGPDGQAVVDTSSP